MLAMKSLALYYFELTLFIVYEFNLLFYFYFFERQQESERKLSVSMRVRALLLRIFNEIPLVHWNIDAQSTFGRGGKRQVKVRDEAVEYARKASRWEMSQTHQNPSKARQARRARSALEEQSSNFLSAFVPKDPTVREKRVRAHFTGGRSSVCLLNTSAGKSMGHCWHPALWNDFSFLGRAPINAQLTPCSRWALWERRVGIYVATRLKGSTLSFSLLLAKIAKRVVHSFWGKSKTNQNTRDLTKVDSVTIFKNIFIHAFQAIKCKKKILFFF